ncbi:peptidoglycan-binding domain-containing protein [Kribbella sp. CA-253562]|uniref:peptidoglycan-binding domain-containing protein n=1 Tax=Kribbella sp. CA-253562 TaxID=3239942 RepID=UPI003D8E560D
MSVISRARALTALPVTVAVLAATVVFSAAAPASAEAASCSGTTLSYGSRGTCVKLLQKNLGGLSVDGVFGEGTRSRVRSFQDDAGLGVDGVVGPATWRKLRTYGKAVGWLSGVTVYLCKSSSTRFQYSVWNNSGKLAWWTLDTVRQADDMRYAFSGNNVPDDRIAVQGKINAGAHDSRMLTVRIGTFDNDKTTDRVRDFARNTLPACG